MLFWAIFAPALTVALLMSGSAFWGDTSIAQCLGFIEDIARTIEAKAVKRTRPEADAARWVRLGGGRILANRKLERHPSYFGNQISIFTSEVGRGLGRMIDGQRFRRAKTNRVHVALRDQTEAFCDAPMQRPYAWDIRELSLRSANANGGR